MFLLITNSFTNNIYIFLSSDTYISQDYGLTSHIPFIFVHFNFTREWRDLQFNVADLVTLRIFATNLLLELGYESGIYG